VPYRFDHSAILAFQHRVAAVSGAIGRLTVLTDQARSLRLRRINRIRAIHGSLAIEGNTLSEAHITAILEGKRVIATPREVREAKNALAACDRFDTWKPGVGKDLLEAHRILMSGLIDEAGLYRHGGVRVMAGSQVIHMAPPADRVPHLMADLFRWLAATEAHPLVASSVFHYEFEFIHPFPDGNGRMGRLWQSLILARRNPLFADIPVESLIFEHQAEYYQAIQESSQRTDSAPFITFMLRMMSDTVTISAPKSALKSPPKSESCWRRSGVRWAARHCNPPWDFRTANPSASATSNRPWPTA
jgi:Fic family protein